MPVTNLPVESQRLKFIATHQKELKAEKYCGLMDAINDGDGNNTGIRTILPPTVYGSPRFYAEAFQDSMAIVGHYEKPSLFITFTCNSNWPEIAEALHPGEVPSDRPDLSCRVFKIKLGKLLVDLIKNEVLGRVNAYTAVTEFQKRGLPHAHILVILAPEDKPQCATDVDCIVCAEIPEIQKNQSCIRSSQNTTSMAPVAQ